MAGLQNLFRSPSEAKRFRDVLTIMLKNQVRNHQSGMTSNELDPEINDSESPVGRLRAHVRSGRLKNLDNNDGLASDKPVEMTQMN